jgi:hypothetical protein
MIPIFFHKRTTSAASAAELILATIEEVPEEKKGREIYMNYNLLIFLWAVEKGYTQQIPLTDPPDDDDTNRLIVRRNNLLDSETVPVPKTKPTTDDKQASPRGSRKGKDEDERPRDDSRPPSRSPTVDKTRRSKGGRRRSRSRSRSTSIRGNRGGPADRRDRRQSRTRSKSRSRNRRESGQRSRSERRSRSRSKTRTRTPDDRRQRSRSPGRPGTPADAITLLGQGVLALATNIGNKMENEALEKSVLGRLSERQKDLFTLLSARDWHDEEPQLNPNAKKLLKSNGAENQWNLVDDWSRSWPGMISKPGCIQFLSQGYASRQNPGEFTVFMFSPKRRIQRGKRDRTRNIKGIYGKKGEIDDKEVDYYASLDYFIPTTIYEGEVMLDMEVTFLETLTARKSIVTDGYAYGIDLIEQHRSTMYDAQEDDHMFIVRYLHFLDVVFNNLCHYLGDFHSHRTLIARARRTLRGRMECNIGDTMQCLRNDVIPNLPAPIHLEDDEDDKVSRLAYGSRPAQERKYVSDDRDAAERRIGETTLNGGRRTPHHLKSGSPRAARRPPNSST